MERRVARQRSNDPGEHPGPLPCGSLDNTDTNQREKQPEIIDTMVPSLPYLDKLDPRLKLQVEQRLRNVFVTQPDDIRNRSEDDVVHIPVVAQVPGRVLEAGVHTLKRTLILKKQSEVDEVNALLSVRRREFNDRLQVLAERRAEVEVQLQETQERARKFLRFVAENEAKRLRAVEKYEAAQAQNSLQQGEIEALTKQLRHLQVRKHKLMERMSRYQIYEDYLMRTVDLLPSAHLDADSDDPVRPIIRRHETLSITHQELRRGLERLEVEAELSQRQLQAMKQQHVVRTLRINKELSELQSELESLQEMNKQAEGDLLMEGGQSRRKVEASGSLLLAATNLADQCSLPAFGPLENMAVPTMMDMVKEFILDTRDTEKRARRLMASASATTSSRAGLADKRTSVKSISSRTLSKSPSKVSKRSDASSRLPQDDSDISNKLHH
ncbi:uncharacterized protein CCDC197 [Synchiropus picturatus]